MSSSTPLLGAPSFSSMSSRARMLINDSGNRSPTKATSKRKKKGGGLRRPLSFLSPFQGHKTPSHKKLADGDAVDQIKNDIASLQCQVRDLNQSYHANGARQLRYNDDSISHSSHDSDDDDEYDTLDNHAHQLGKLNQKLLHIQTGLVAIESERCHLLTKGKQVEEQIEMMEDQLSSKDNQIQLLQQENLKLRQQSFRQQESRPFEVQQMKNKYDNISSNFVKVCEKLAKSSKRIANMEFEKKALIALNQALQSKIQRSELRSRKEQENMQEILKHNANQLADLEDLLKEKSKLVDKLDNQLSAKDSNAAATIHSSNAYFERKHQLARKQHEADVQALKHSHTQQIKSLQLKLHEKSSEYEALRDEFDAQMQRLMTATAEIDRFSDERAAVETLIARLDSLDRECADYKEILFAKDTKIAVLRADNMKKDLEMKYSTPQNATGLAASSRQSSPVPTEHQHSISRHHVITPQRAQLETKAMCHLNDGTSSESKVLREIQTENAQLKERLRQSRLGPKQVTPDIHHVTSYGASTVSTVTLLDDSLDWGIEESRISNTPSQS